MIIVAKCIDVKGFYQIGPNCLQNSKPMVQIE